jgi:hypothetical protein
MADPSIMMDTSDVPLGHYVWMLDFTDGGKNPGVVMSQSRMRDIELVVNPLGGIDGLNSVGMISFGTGSWVDLLVRDHPIIVTRLSLNAVFSSMPEAPCRRRDIQLYMLVLISVTHFQSLMIHSFCVEISHICPSSTAIAIDRTRRAWLPAGKGACA